MGVFLRCYCFVLTFIYYITPYCFYLLATVKTYHSVNATNELATFEISKMEDIYSIRKGKADEPHRHHYYTVLLVKQAKGIHKIDFNAYDLGPQQIYFVAPGQVHQVIETEQTIGFAMTFSTQFLIENAIKVSFIESLNLFNNYGQSPPLTLNKEQFNKLELFATEIFSLKNSTAHLKEQSIGSYLKLLLIECNTICSINPIEHDGDITGNHTLRTFKKLVDVDYKAEHSTSYYASKLSITPDHLNRIVKTAIGKTAKEYIQSRIITEAKRLLYFSELSTKEIGFELGFNEPANFSAFFKNATQLSPSEFKQHKL